MNKKFSQAIAAGLVVLISVTSFAAVVGEATYVEAKKSTVQLAGDQVTYLESTLKNNYLGNKNLGHFNLQLRKSKNMVSKLPSGATKNSFNQRIAKSENVIRATESVVKLEDSMNKNSHTMSSVPAFEGYINRANTYINRIHEGTYSSAKVGLSQRSYKRFNDIRDIKVKNTIEYSYANQLYNEANVLYQRALASSSKENVASADNKVSEALKAVYSVSTSVIKDKLKGNIKVLVNKVSKLPGSSIPGGGTGGGGNGGGGTLPPVDPAKPTIRLNGDVYIKIKKNDKFIDAGYVAVDSVDGDITHKVKVVYQKDGVPISSINTSVEGSYLVVYSVTNSRGKTQTAYRWLAVGDAVIPGFPGSGGGSGGGTGGGGTTTGPDKTPPVITLKGDLRMFVKYGGSFVDPGYTVTDNVDSSTGIRVDTEIYYNNSVKVQGITTTKPGFYTITYSATDKSGNVGQAVRNITVEEINADTDASLISAQVEGVNIDLKTAANFSTPAEVKYIQNDPFRGIDIVAGSRKTMITVVANGGVILATGNGAVKYSNSLVNTENLLIETKSADGRDSKYYRINLVKVGDTDKTGIAKVVLESDDSAQVRKILKGAYRNIYNSEWEDLYVKDIANNLPGIVMVKGTDKNRIYDKNGKAIDIGIIGDATEDLIRETIYLVNEKALEIDDKRCANSYDQAIVSSDIDKYLKDSQGKVSKKKHSLAKESLFKIYEATDGRTVSDNLSKYIALESPELQLGTNLVAKDINPYLDSEYLEVLTESNNSIKKVLFDKIVNLNVNGGYPDIKSLIVDPANNRSLTNTIKSIVALKSSINSESAESSLRGYLTRLENVTSHRRETSDPNRKVFKPLGDKTKDYTIAEEEGLTGNYYYYDINFKKYIDQIVIALAGKTDDVVTVEEGIKKANELAKVENKNDINELIGFINTGGAVLNDDSRNKVLSSLEKMSLRLITGTTNEFDSIKASTSTELNAIKRREIAQVLRNLIVGENFISGANKDKLTIKKIIAYADRLDGAVKSNYILQNAMGTYNSQINLFKVLGDKMLNTYRYDRVYIVTPNSSGDRDNLNQWEEQRAGLISDITNYITESNTTINWRSPSWVTTFNANDDNKKKITHYIINNNKLITGTGGNSE
ncbi:MAG: DUF5011 domain-containing protein, partial [Clostridium sp.]